MDVINTCNFDERIDLRQNVKWQHTLTKKVERTKGGENTTFQHCCSHCYQLINLGILIFRKKQQRTVFTFQTSVFPHPSSTLSSSSQSTEQGCLPSVQVSPTFFLAPKKTSFPLVSFTNLITLHFAFIIISVIISLKNSFMTSLAQVTLSTLLFI